MHWNLKQYKYAECYTFRKSVSDLSVGASELILGAGRRGTVFLVAVVAAVIVLKRKAG
jgi:hypothetical protein